MADAMEYQVEDELEMEMERITQPSYHEQFNPRDRLSDLPEFILLHIFSLLDAVDACSAASLSRKFRRLRSTLPVLDFDVVRFPKLDFIYFIHKTMRRYSINNTIIKEFKLKIEIDELFACYLGGGGLIDDWIRIAVTNQVEFVDLCILPWNEPGADYLIREYKLPEILLSAKSLKILKLQNVEFFDRNCGDDNKSMNLWSLECLDFNGVYFRDDSLLRRMICSCPLKVVKIEDCPGYISQLNFSHSSKIKEAEIRQEDIVFGTVELINLEAYTVENLSYYGHGLDQIDDWPLRIEDPGKLLNLRKLTIGSASITDEVVASLVPRLPSLGSLTFYNCYGLKRAKFSSFSLERFELEYCSKLEKLEIDAPKIDSFHFSSYLYDKYPILSLSKCPNHCTSLVSQVWPQYIKTCYFTRLREFLVRSNLFSVLTLSLAVRYAEDFNVEDVVGEIPTGPPYKLRQLELTIHDTTTPPTESAISAVVEGLFWCCHPHILSLPLNMAEPRYVSTRPDVHKIIVQKLIQKLSSYAISWRHALNGIEVESTDWDHLYEISDLRGLMDFKFNLCW